MRCCIAHCDFHMRNILDDVHLSSPILLALAAACISSSRFNMNDTGIQNDDETWTFDDSIFTQTKFCGCEDVSSCDSLLTTDAGQLLSKTPSDTICRLEEASPKSGEVWRRYFGKSKALMNILTTKHDQTENQGFMYTDGTLLLTVSKVPPSLVGTDRSIVVLGRMLAFKMSSWSHGVEDGSSSFLRLSFVPGRPLLLILSRFIECDEVPYPCVPRICKKMNLLRVHRDVSSWTNL